MSHSPCLLLSCLNAIAGLINGHRFNLLYRGTHKLAGASGRCPYISNCKDAWDNHGWIITVAIIMIIVPLNSGFAIMTGASRVLWAFSKHGGLPASKRIGHTNTRFLAPVNAVLATALRRYFWPGFVSWCLGRQLFLSSIFGSSGICMAVSYTVPILFMMLKDLKNLSERRFFNLGKFRRPINCLALCWEATSLSCSVFRPTGLSRWTR
jgi:amino acid transporter